MTGLYSAFFTVLWKFIMISFTRVDTNNIPFSAGDVMQSTIRRLVVRVEAYVSMEQLESATAVEESEPPTTTSGALTNTSTHWRQ